MNTANKKLFRKSERVLFLLPFERKKSYYSCPFNSFGKHSLMLGANAGHTTGKHFAFLGNVFTEFSYVFIVDMFGFFNAELANFFLAHSFKRFFSGSCRRCGSGFRFRSRRGYGFFYFVHYYSPLKIQVRVKAFVKRKLA